MAIPQDGLNDREIQLLKAYESTAKVLGDPAVAAYVDADGLKVTMGNTLEEVVDSAASTLGSDHAKLSAFLDAVKTEASDHGLSTVTAKVESLAGAHGASSGAAPASGAGSEPSPAPSGDSDGETEESESSE